MKNELLKWACEVQVGLHRRAPERILSPLIAEIVGARFMRLLGIGAPEEIRAGPIREDDSSDWICKSLKDGRLRVGGDAAILIKKIPRAISLVSLRDLYGISSSPPMWDIPRSSLPAGVHRLVAIANCLTGRLVLTFGEIAANLRDFLHTGREQLSNPREFFVDFVPPEDWTAVKNAIEWNSQQMLMIHAARLFLGCTTAHAGNILVDASGKLYSVDHELCARTNGEEISMLAANVKPGTMAARSAGRIASLSSSDVERLFDGLRSEVVWPTGDKGLAVRRYQERLRHWQGSLQDNGVSHAENANGNGRQ